MYQTASPENPSSCVLGEASETTRASKQCPPAEYWCAATARRKGYIGEIREFGTWNTWTEGKVFHVESLSGWPLCQVLWVLSYLAWCSAQRMIIK